MNHGQQIDQRSERLSNDVAGLFAFRLEAIKRINAIEQRLDDLTAPVVESLVEPASDVPLPEGCRRETRSVLIVPTRSAGDATVFGFSTAIKDYPVIGCIGSHLESWTPDGSNIIGSVRHDDLTVSLTAEQWKALLGVNQP